MRDTQNCKRLSVEQMNKLLLEKIPLCERLKAVYLPIIAMDCVCYLAEDLLDMLKRFRLDSTKKSSRVIRACVDGYRKDNCQVMHSDLYRNLTNSTKEFYDSLSRDMLIFQVQYRQAMLDRNMEFDSEAGTLVAVSYIMREIAGLVIELDREFSKRVSDLLGEGITYTTEDNKYCLEIIRAINELFGVIRVPSDLQTVQTEMAMRVFRNKLNSVQLW